MLIKNNNPRGTEENFRNSLKMVAIFMLVMIVLGIAMVVGVLAVNSGVFIPEGHQESYSSGVFTGLGSALIAIGLVRLVRAVRTFKNPEIFKTAYIEYTDERNQFLAMKAYQISAYIFLILLAIAILAMNFVSSVVTSTLSVCIGSFSLILTVTYRIMKSRY